MHIYVFGSVCRGEVTPGSDVDMLALTEGFDSRFDPAAYSIYSYERIGEMWKNGTPFAWHLALESRLIHCDDGRDHLRDLGAPAAYKSGIQDCLKFRVLFEQACEALSNEAQSRVFELSNIFLAVRNFATCFSLGYGGRADFSRSSAKRLGPNSLRIGRNAYDVLERARLLSTRGKGAMVELAEVKIVEPELERIRQWMTDLAAELERYERI